MVRIVYNMQVSNPTGIDSTVLLFWIIINILWFLLLFTDLPDKIRIYRWDRVIRFRLSQIEGLALETRKASEDHLKELGIKEPGPVIDGFVNNNFLIEPVSIEPIDIVRRLGHLIRVRDDKIKSYAASILPNADQAKRENLEVILEINWVLSYVHRVVRHFYLLGKKTQNWMLLYQLVLILPALIKELEAYKKAVEPFRLGIPIGDSAGPLVVSMMAPNAERIRITDETVYSTIDLEGRRVYLIKAEGPGGTVGRPGEAVAKLAEQLECRISRIITVDAALKLEGEKSGEVAEGTGAAIGDPGPEKISIERTAIKCGAPLDAVIIKMSSEEAITHMTKEIYEGVSKAVEVVKRIIRERTKEGDQVIVAGIGNTLGVL
ncbi:MAG: DUF1512 domain-containing protein [Desulfurococcaceae archaeon]|jgi:hypothetical protein|nr:MAG: DUF1512 domain-containing protein [Desulfurococcaceae archaeon]